MSTINVLVLYWGRRGMITPGATGLIADEASASALSRAIFTLCNDESPRRHRHHAMLAQRESTNARCFVERILQAVPKAAKTTHQGVTAYE